MADPTASFRRGALALLASAGLVLGGCGGDDADADADQEATTTATDAPSTAADAPSTAAEEPATDDVAAFCAEMERLDGETTEAYVGSDQHVADIEGLAAVAPDDVRPAVERYRDFLASGAVTADDPSSNETDGWPEDVQADIAEIRDARDARC